MLGSRGRSRAVTGVPGILKSNTVVRSTVVRMGEGRESSFTMPSTRGTRAILVRKTACVCVSVSLKSLHTVVQKLVTGALSGRD